MTFNYIIADSHNTWTQSQQVDNAHPSITTTTIVMSVQMSLQRCHTVSSARPFLSKASIAARATPASPLTRRQHHHICRAESSETPPATTSTEQQQPQQPQQTEQPAAPSAPLLAPGQGTAIVTGAISIIFGIAYLVLVSLLDMRGGELQPPPPEAFMQ